MKEQYIEILERYLLHCWIFLGVGIAICVIWLVYELIKKEITKEDLLVVLIICILCVVGIKHTVDVRLDINKNSIKTIYYNSQAYTTDDDQSSGSWLDFSQKVNIVDSNGRMIMLNCRDDIFPYDAANSGTIIYATHTKMILEYIPDQGNTGRIFSPQR